MSPKAIVQAYNLYRDQVWLRHLDSSWDIVMPYIMY